MEHPSHGTGAVMPRRVRTAGQGARHPMQRHPEPGSGRVMNVAAALVSVGLIGALGIWGYGQVQRDVSGVPVVRALEGPMRDTPEDPGGLVAANAGLSINNVQAAGAAEAPAQEIALAPPVTRLDDEDLPQNSLRQEALIAAATQEESLEEVEIVDIPVVEDTDALAQALALADQLTSDAAPLSSVADAEAVEGPDSDAVAEAVAEALQETIPETVVLGPGVKRSPRPVPRPGLPKAGIVDTSAPGDVVLDINEVAVGTRLVQIGAFDTPDAARDAWSTVDLAVNGILVDKSRLIQEAEAGGRKFWRLRVHGFEDLSSARRFCAAVAVTPAAKDCIPVVAR